MEILKKKTLKMIIIFTVFHILVICKAQQNESRRALGTYSGRLPNAQPSMVPEIFIPEYGYVSAPKSADAADIVSEMLGLLSQNDEKECVLRMLCEQAAVGVVGEDGRMTRDPSMDWLIRNTPKDPHPTLVNNNTDPALLALNKFIDAIFFGTQHKNQTMCWERYSRCPKDTKELANYMQKHNGGFTHFFNGENYTEHNGDTLNAELHNNYNPDTGDPLERDPSVVSQFDFPLPKQPQQLYQSATNPEQQYRFSANTYPQSVYPQQQYQPEAYPYQQQAAYSGQQYGQPLQNGYQQSGYQQSGYQQPGYQQPGYQQPGYQQTGYQQPGYKQSGYQQPGYQQRPLLRSADPQEKDFSEVSKLTNMWPTSMSMDNMDINLGYIPPSLQQASPFSKDFQRRSFNTDLKANGKSKESEDIKGILNS